MEAILTVLQSQGLSGLLLLYPVLVSWYFITRMEKRVDKIFDRFDKTDDKIEEIRLEVNKCGRKK